MVVKTENFKNSAHPSQRSKRKKQVKAAMEGANFNLEDKLIKVLSTLSKFGRIYSKNARDYTKENVAKGLVVVATVGFIAKRFFLLLGHRK